MNQEDKDQIVGQLRKAAEAAQCRVQAIHSMAQITPQAITATVQMNVLIKLAEIFDSLRAE